MADVLSKTSLISSWHRYNNNNHHHHQQQQSISVFPKNCNYKSFSCSLILKPEITSYKTDFHGKRIGLQQHRPLSIPRPCQASSVTNTSVQKTGFRIGKAHKWWEKGVQPNMKEISSAQDLVDSLTNAGDKLVVVDFFSPGCGGCKALHPKICQFAEMNPDVQFLQVNYEDHKSMCYSLNVHVLPFFRFYRGAHGRVCSFSCTNATIKKFRDALAKHKPDRCSLGPTKGLEEKELIALASNKDISFNYSRLHEPVPQESEVEAVPPSRQNSGPLPLPSTTLKSPQSSEGRNMVSAGR